MQGILAGWLQQAVLDVSLGTTGTLSTESSCLAFSLDTTFQVGPTG